MIIHRTTAEQALKSLRSGPDGLTSASATRRLIEFGPNRVPKVAQKPLFLKFLREFTHLLALVLWFAAVLAFVANYLSPGEGMLTLGLAIVGVVVINGVFSFWQEFRAERALKALEKLLPRTATVVRGGAALVVAVEELVPGDVLVVEEGDDVPADSRIIEAYGLRVNMATVTGEALPKARDAHPSEAEDQLRAQNILLAGTSVVSGRGKAVVFATGARTEFAKIAHLTQLAHQSPSPLQLEIATTSRRVCMVAIGVGVAFFIIGNLAGIRFWSNFTFAIGIIVAFVPEGLLPTVTLSLAMAAQRMAKKNALVRHLPAIEALGSATVIVTDKTGTLTQNRMMVREVYLNSAIAAPSTLSPSDQAAHGILTVAAICHDLKTGADGEFLGDPMEKALAELAKARPVYKRLDELAFDTDRKRLTVLVETDGARKMLTKGAPETVLPLCSTMVVNGARVELDPVALAEITAVQEKMADEGLRVLAFAVREVDSDKAEGQETEMTFVGLVALLDPPRPEVKDAMGKCRTAGIRVLMATGDNPRTALAIAREVGLATCEQPLVMTGDSLKHLTETQLQLALDTEEIIFARLTADQKLRIVTALKNKGEIVAVTGDGVNDAPALKSADIGIAMGISGVEVARAASDMVLLDDNFATIVAAIEEGRAVFDNIRKFLTLILTSNMPEAVPFLCYVLLDMPLALTIMQILAVDLGTDLLPALALGAEKAGPGVMARPPRKRGARLLSGKLLARSYLWLGLLEAAAAMAAFLYVLKSGGWQWGVELSILDPLYLKATTATLAAIVAMQVANVYICRDARRSVFAKGIEVNRLIWWGIAVEVAAVLLISYTPPGNYLFGAAPLDLATLLFLLPLPVAMLAVEAGRKALAGRIMKKQDRP